MDVQAANGVSREAIAWCYKLFLGREPASQDVADSHFCQPTLDTLRAFFATHPEFRAYLANLVPHPAPGMIEEVGRFDDIIDRIDAATTTSSFRVPDQLDRGTYVQRRALLIGQCLLDTWPGIVQRLHPQVELQRIDFNHVTRLPPAPPRPVDDYDMQIISLPLRSILPEAEYMRMDVTAPDDARALLERAKDRIDLQLHETLTWHRSHALTSLVCNLLVPQQNPLGRTIARNDPRNLCFLVEELNRHIADVVTPMTGVHLLDLDAIAASIGKRHVQDDALCASSHGSLLDNYGAGADRHRIAPPTLTIEQTFGAKCAQFVEEVWLEACAIMRTVRRVDAVKLVIMDLDDTMWRGLLAEEVSVGAEAVEGWPLGVWEALAFLRKRGVILAIASKNDERNVTPIFDALMKTRLPLEAFAIRKIDWNSKIDNVGAIIREANVGSDATVFVDDNPAERMAVQAAFPDVRTIGADPYALKRILLWSAETQVETITRESSERNATVAASVARTADRARMTREEFLTGLGTRMTLVSGANLDAGRLERAFELLNKTNQFNTTGERWERATFDKALRDLSMQLMCFEVEDISVNYGLVGIILLNGSEIRQAVLSCRVFGMEIEDAALEEIARALFEAGVTEVTGRLIHTERNTPCRTWFSNNGFTEHSGTWRLPRDDWRQRSQRHVKVSGHPFGRMIADDGARGLLLDREALGV